MTKGEIEMLTGLIEHEIFHAEGVVNAFNSKESIRHLGDLQSILKSLQKPDGRFGDNLGKEQKNILVHIIKQAQLETHRILEEQEKIKKIQQDSSILNKLERSLYAT